VRFHLFYELALPPTLDRDEPALYADTIDEIVLGDELGFAGAWLVEHHFTRHYSHCSKPDLVLAALSQRTKRIRLGLGVIPLPFHHPVHTAERVATLDILTRGRLDVGIGRGFSPREYEVFGVGMEDSRALTQEALDILCLSFTGRPIEHAGQHFHFSPVELFPHVVQIPHPPLWCAAVSPETFDWAARQGLNVLAGPFKPWFMTRHDITHFREAWREGHSPRIGMAVGVLCLEDGRRARQMAAEAFTWFYRELWRQTLPVLERLYPGYTHYRELGRFRHLLGLGVNMGLLESFGMVVAGDPETCDKAFRRFEKAGVTDLLCALGAGALPTETVRESMSCLARSVLPRYGPLENAGAYSL
jgi:alkanesulfonate monooxygenase SsuD/methylene tetrahydromethanopterin reductase-like flavin-dependent oxidoreductase (luciferase family)